MQCRLARAMGLVLTFLLVACQPTSVFVPEMGSGQVTIETRQVNGATDLIQTCPGVVDVTFGDKEQVTIEAEDNLLSSLTTEVKNGRLNLGVRGAIYATKGIHYTVELKGLKSVEEANAGSISLRGIQADSLKLSATNVGSISAEGTAQTLTAVAGNVGSIDAGALQAGEVSAEVSGAGSITVWAVNRLAATVRSSAAGDIRYYGQPPDLVQKDDGPGNIVSLGAR